MKKGFKVILIYFFIVALSVACWAQSPPTGYSLFFTNQYRNPALSSGLDKPYVDVQSLLTLVQNNQANNLFLSGHANAPISGSRFNAGVSYQFQESRCMNRNRVGLNIGHRIFESDNRRLNAGLQLALSNFTQKDCFIPLVGGYDAHLIPQEYAFTENAGLWYQSPRYYAGFTVENFFTLAEEKRPFETTPDNPLAVNATFARHLSLGDLTLSPAVSYHYQTEERSVHYYHDLEDKHFHQFKPGIMAQFNDRYFLAFRPVFEMTRTPFYKDDFNNFEAKAGIKFWDQLLIRSQVRFPQNYRNSEMTVGLDVTWLMEGLEAKNQR